MGGRALLMIDTCTISFLVLFLLPTLLVFFTTPPPSFSYLPSLSMFPHQIPDPTSLLISPFSPNPKLTPTSREPGYIPPKRPYSFTALLDDILHFASLTLVENGRLAMWMPTANDEDIELAIPTHPCLKVVSVCVQPFNKCKISVSPSVLPHFPFYIRMHLSTSPFRSSSPVLLILEAVIH